MKKAVIFIKGGLGNQLFQFAFANYLKSKGFNVIANTELLKQSVNNTPRQLILPLSNFGLKEENVFSKLVFNLGMQIDSNSLVNKTYLQHFFKEFKYTKNIQDINNSASKKLFLNSYWKDMKYAEFSKNYISASLKKNSKINTGFLQNNNKTMLHVRRGDFVKNNWNLDSSFYKKGLEIINNNGEFDFDIFTDDPKWVSQQSIFHKASNVYYQKTSQSLDSGNFDNMDDRDETVSTFSKMLCYKHFVVGNSSFAFWAAFLKGKNDSVVVVPEPWFKNNDHPVLKKIDWHTVRNV